MHVRDIFKADRTTFSFEFFPPKSESAAEDLYRNIAELEPLKPSFVSVTYGAGGGTRQRTHDLVVRIKQTTSLDPIPHLTSVCHSADEIESVLERYAAADISNVLALGGDLPRDRPDHDRTQDAFRYAGDLVRFIREFNEAGRHPDPRGFGIGVAGFPEGHPAEPQRVRELDHLKQKVDAGAHYICTQFFFDNRDFHDYRARCERIGVEAPIVAGIMPITSQQMFERLPDFALGARYPIDLLHKIDACNGDNDAIFEIGVEWATEQCRDLLDHDVRGLHFYCLNKWEACKRVFDNLNITEVAGRRGDANPSLQTSK